MVDSRQAFRLAVLVGLGATSAAWYPFSTNPGVVGKFLGLYCLGAYLSIWAISKLLTGTLRISTDMTIMFLLAVFLAFIALSAVSSQNPLTVLGSSKHREGFVTFIFYALALLLMSDDEAGIDPRSIGAVLSISTILSLFLGYAWIERSFAEQYGNRFTGGFGEPNFLAGFLVLSIPMILLLAVRAGTPSARFLGLAGLAAALGQLFFSQSRAGYISLAISALAFGLIAWKKGAGRFRHAYLLAPLTFFPWALLSGRFSWDSLRTGAITRVSSWHSISETGKYVFIGPGPDRFQFATHNQYGIIGPQNVFINYAGNIGWLAVAAYALLILLVLWRLAQTINDSDWSEALPATILFTSILGYSIFSFLSYTRSYVNIIFWILLGLALHFSTPSREWRPPAPLRFGLALSMMTIIVIVLVASMQIIVAGYHVRLAMHARSEQQIWVHLSSAISHEGTNFTLRKKRGELALSFLSQEMSGRPVGLDFVDAAIEDWEFLYGQVWNDLESYRYLEQFYTHVGLPDDERLEPPEGL